MNIDCLSGCVIGLVFSFLGEVWYCGYEEYPCSKEIHTQALRDEASECLQFTFKWFAKTVNI